MSDPTLSMATLKSFAVIFLAFIRQLRAEHLAHYFGHGLLVARVDQLGFDKQRGVLIAMASGGADPAYYRGDRHHFIPFHAFIFEALTPVIAARRIRVLSRAVPLAGDHPVFLPSVPLALLVM
jgi:hypothetical protein